MTGLPRLPIAFALAAALLAPACGLASRDLFLRLDFEDVARAQGDAAPLRSVDPAQPGLWLYDAQRAARADDVEAALELLERGSAFRPDDSSLLGARIEVLQRMEREEEALAATDEALASLPPAVIVPGLRFQRLVLLLALERLDDAEHEARRLGGTPFVPREFVAEAWARLALSREALGQPREADDALDRALAGGPFAAAALRGLALETSEHGAAASALLARATARHPRHPDVQLQSAIDLLARGEIEIGIERLDALPQPLPSRLAGLVELLRAQAALEAGDVDDGLERLTRRLDAVPSDIDALFLLAEAWRRTGRPPTDTVRGYVLRARHRAPRGLLPDLDAMLDALEAEGRDASARPPADAGEEPTSPAPSPAGPASG